MLARTASRLIVAAALAAAAGGSGAGPSSVPPAVRDASQARISVDTSAAAPAATKGKFTAEQVANLQEHVQRAQQLVARFAAEATAQGRSDGWRKVMLEQLLALPLSSLRALDNAPTLAALEGGARVAATQLKALGSNSMDLVYTPVPPCRYIDTRDPFGPGRIDGFRGYDISLDGGNFGGAATCNPVTLAQVAADNLIGGMVMNVTIVDPVSAPGFVAVKPTTGSPTSSLVNWYQAGPTVQAANQAIVTIDQTAALQEFWIQASSPVNVVVDIFGFFTAPHVTGAACASTVATDLAVAAGTAALVTSPSCTTLPPGSGYSVASGSCSSTSDQVFLVSSANSGSDAWTCGFRNTSGATQTASVAARCCRVP